MAYSIPLGAWISCGGKLCTHARCKSQSSTEVLALDNRERRHVRCEPALSEAQFKYYLRPFFINIRQKWKGHIESETTTFYMKTTGRVIVSFSPFRLCCILGQHRLDAPFVSLSPVHSAPKDSPALPLSFSLMACLGWWKTLKGCCSWPWFLVDSFPVAEEKPVCRFFFFFSFATHCYVASCMSLPC